MASVVLPVLSGTLVACIFLFVSTLLQAIEYIFLPSFVRLQFSCTNPDWTICGDAQGEVWPVSQSVPTDDRGHCPRETHHYRTHGQDCGYPQDTAQGNAASVSVSSEV